MRRQFEMVSDQNEERGGLAQEITTEAAGAMSTRVFKVFNKAG